MSSCFSVFQFSYCHLCVYIIYWFSDGSAVGTYIVHSSTLSFSVPSCRSKCCSSYSDYLCRTFSLLLTMLTSLSVISNVCNLNPFLILFTSLQNFFASLLLQAISICSSFYLKNTLFLSKYFVYFFSFIFIFVFMLSGISVNHIFFIF